MRHFDHINVMPMLGVCFSPSNNDDSSAGPSLVMPFMEKGSLLDYIRKEADRLFTSTEDEVILQESYQQINGQINIQINIQPF